MGEFIAHYRAGEKSQTLLLLHGTGGDEQQLMELGARVLPGANRLGVRGRVSEGGANRFFRRFAEGIFDEEDLTRQAGDLANFVGEQAVEKGFDPAQVFALGYSNGANIAAGLLLLHPEALAGGVLLHAMPPLGRPPASELTGKPVLVTLGLRDPIVTPEQAQSLVTILNERGAKAELWPHPGGHELSASEIEKVTQWFRERG